MLVRAIYASHSDAATEADQNRTLNPP
jgi:hypothetical protein